MKATVAHESGLKFRVIDADSSNARTARGVHSLTMTDGTVWIVGTPVGWLGTEAAWKPAECGPQDIVLGGGSIAYIYCVSPTGHDGKHTP
jgi:hypothetical protein